MKQKDLVGEMESYFRKNGVAGLNSIFIKFGHGVAVIKALSLLIGGARHGGSGLVESGEMTYKVYRWRD